jgi:hypothetical protein
MNHYCPTTIHFVRKQVQNKVSQHQILYAYCAALTYFLVLLAASQGATCYMNSLMQQLFHSPRFRQRILSARPDAPPSSSPLSLSPSSSASSPSSSPSSSAASFQPGAIIYQLQTMFAYLQVSQKRFYDTLPFCHALTDFDGQPLRLTEQKDANEFCALLFDKIEVYLVNEWTQIACRYLYHLFHEQCGA